MPWSALPERLRTPEAWKGTDWDNPFQRWLLKYKGWFAVGPRSTPRWARWREWPITVLAVKGMGRWRFEDDVAPFAAWFYSPILLWASKRGRYLSRCQTLCRWSIQIQWPLLIAVHWYPSWRAMGEGERPWFFYVGFPRDADKVYWLGAVFFGRTWK